MEPASATEGIPEAIAHRPVEHASMEEYVLIMCATVRIISMVITANSSAIQMRHAIAMECACQMGDVHAIQALKENGVKPIPSNMLCSLSASGMSKYFQDCPIRPWSRLSSQ
jgi:hypothetical protein